MKRFGFRQILSIIGAIVLMSLMLLFWRYERQNQIRRHMQSSVFRQHHYYNLIAGKDTVCHFDEISDVYNFIHRDSVLIDSIYKMLCVQNAELGYYLKVHNVTDEGYNMIADYANEISQKTDSILRLLIYLQKIDSGMPYRLQHEVRYTGRHRPLLQDNIKGDSAGIYIGEMDSLRRPDGHGTYRGYDGSYYQGHWQEGQRNGFGFSIVPWKQLRVGEWQNDVYLGERITYTSDRIYGIDISRYQHEQGKKKYSINWNKLRITHLGSKSKKSITGTVDYPIAFIYIKSTEGTSIRNKFFLSDYTNAKRRNIKVGAYHFFSTRTSGMAQAQYFLKNTRFRHGDFPPVLDVEPSASQIKAMGGKSVLLARIRSWMSIVEKHVGVRPILYVSQTFVNRYLADAQDIKKNYKIWIARYGEYKPDIQLVIWQLCPDGRVSGIHGHVDINVFNGYSDVYEDFLTTSLIP